MRNSCRGFTLLEVLLSIIILSLLTGGIYTVIHGSITAVDGLYTEQEAQMSDAALAELLRKSFACLPMNAILTLSVRQQQDALLSDLRVENAPGLFSWGSDAWNYGAMAMRSEKGNGQLIRFGIQQIGDGGSRGRSISLAEGFQEFRWEFYSVREQRWMGEWARPDERPALARLLYRRKDDANPVEMTFAFPWSSNHPDMATAQVTP